MVLIEQNLADVRFKNVIILLSVKVRLEYSWKASLKCLETPMMQQFPQKYFGRTNLQKHTICVVCVVLEVHLHETPFP